MKRVTIILLLALGLAHCVWDVSSHNYNFSSQQNTIIELLSDEEVFMTLTNELSYEPAKKYLHHTSDKLTVSNVSQIWKPPVNAI